MATLLELKTAIASYFNKTVSDLTINGQDLCLLALNQVRLQAELNHDFEFSRKLVTVAVDGVTGGSLDSAVLYGTTTTLVKVKSVVDVGYFDDQGNFKPIEWTTVGDSLNRQRDDNPYGGFPRYPTDGQAITGPIGQSRLQFSGNNIYKFPKVENDIYTIGLEVYAFCNDWTGIVTVAGTLTPDATGTFYQGGIFNEQPFYIRQDGLYLVFFNSSLNLWILAPPGDDVLLPFWQSTGTVISDTYSAQISATGAATVNFNTIGSSLIPDPLSISDIWTTKGQQYLQWGSIVHLNHHFKEYVYRQEGNISDQSPAKLAAEGLDALKSWDIFKYEQSRRHSR